jgi:AAHS family 3-hydroxyphenylpropionic acid transporter
MTSRSQIPITPIIISAVVAMLEGFDLQSAGVAAPRLAPALHIDPASLSIFFSSSTFGMMLGASAGGRLADFIGRKSTLMLSLFLFGLFSLSTAFAWDLTSLVTARFLTGVGLGGALPTLLAVVTEAASERRRIVAVSVLYAGMPVGGSIAALVTLLGANDWRVVFIVGGLLPIVAVALVARFLSILLVRKTESSVPPNIPVVLFGEGRMRPTVLLWVGFFLALLALYMLVNWLPSLLVARGMARSQAAWVQIAFNMSGATGAVIVGWLMDQPKKRAITAATIFVSAVVMLLVMRALPSEQWAIFVICGLFGAAVQGSQVCFYGLAPLFYPRVMRGTGVGMAVAIGRIGAVVGPMLAGKLLASGMAPDDVMFVLLPVMAVAGIAAFVLTRRPIAADAPISVPA